MTSVLLNPKDNYSSFQLWLLCSIWHYWQLILLKILPFPGFHDICLSGSTYISGHTIPVPSVVSSVSAHPPNVCVFSRFLLLPGKCITFHYFHYHLKSNVSQILSLFQIFLLSFWLKKEHPGRLPTHHHLHMDISQVPQTQHLQTYLTFLYDSVLLSSCSYLWTPGPTTQCLQVRWNVNNYNVLDRFISRCCVAMASILAPSLKSTMTG